jgi:PIN domain nuclease of toxin-antitoxin system
MINLDTHVLVFAITGKLSEYEQAVLSPQRWGISAMVLWELAMLSDRGRIDVDLSNPEIVAFLSGLYTWPIDLPVAMQSTRLDFRSDPADEIIAATSIVHNVPLLTRDKVIRKSKLVPLA